MSRSASDEEIKLRKRARRRLIGAIALTTLVVVALPMVLDNEPRPLGDDIAVQIPSPNSGPYAPKGQGDTVPRPGAASPAPAPAPAVASATASGAFGSAPSAAMEPIAPVNAPAPGRAVGAVPAAPAQSSATPADQKIVVSGALRQAAEAPGAAAAAKVAEAKVAEAKDAEAKDAEAKNFVIQLGAFAEANRAKERHAQLVKAGIRSYTEVIKTPTGDKTRVRAGPFPTRQAAELANERVEALGISDGIVVPRRY